MKMSKAAVAMQKLHKKIEHFFTTKQTDDDLYELVDGLYDLKHGDLKGFNYDGYEDRMDARFYNSYMYDDMSEVIGALSHISGYLWRKKRKYDDDLYYQSPEGMMELYRYTSALKEHYPILANIDDNIAFPRVVNRAGTFKWFNEDSCRTNPRTIHVKLISEDFKIVSMSLDVTKAKQVEYGHLLLTNHQHYGCAILAPHSGYRSTKLDVDSLITGDVMPDDLGRTTFGEYGKFRMLEMYYHRHIGGSHKAPIWTTSSEDDKMLLSLAEL